MKMGPLCGRVEVSQENHTLYRKGQTHAAGYHTPSPRRAADASPPALAGRMVAALGRASARRAPAAGVRPAARAGGGAAVHAGAPYAERGAGGAGAGGHRPGRLLPPAEPRAAVLRNVDPLLPAPDAGPGADGWPVCGGGGWGAGAA